LEFRTEIIEVDSRFVPLSEVSLLTWEGDYVRLSSGKLQPLCARSLAAIELRLDSKKFFRANRSQIVNLDFIESVDLGASGRLHVQLRGGPEVEISRRQSQLFKQRSSV
jgi:two-component system, LytTR family, response regulator